MIPIDLKEKKIAENMKISSNHTLQQKNREITLITNFSSKQNKIVGGCKNTHMEQFLSNQNENWRDPCFGSGGSYLSSRFKTNRYRDVKI